MFFATIFKVVWSHLKALNNLVQEIRVLSERWSSLRIHRELLKLLPAIVQTSWGCIKFFFKWWVALKIILGNVRVSALYFIFLIIVCSWFFSNLVYSICILNFEDLWLLLLAASVMLASSPIVIKFSSDLSIFLLNFRFEYKWVLKKLRPCKPFIWCFVQESLQKRFEVWGHVVWEFDWIFDN